jgi:hypothetical protein
MTTAVLRQKSVRRALVAASLVAMLPACGRAKVFTKLTSPVDTYAAAGCGWIDYNQDGKLDVYLPHFNAGCFLYANEGNGGFRLLNNGDLDLYVGTIYEKEELLYLNNGDGTFTATHEFDINNSASGTGVTGASLGDYDNDGFLDLLVADAGGNGPILYFNGPAVGNVQIKGNNVKVAYSDVQGGFAGEGNISADPAFAALGAWSDASTYIPGDLHLKSKAGRWDPWSCAWVQDETTSPCVDTGDSKSPLEYEALGCCGTVIDMGAYGGTLEASRTTAE